MPNDYATRLSADEITNIVGFLRMQQGRDLTKTVAQPITGGGVTYQRLDQREGGAAQLDDVLG